MRSLVNRAGSVWNRVSETVEAARDWGNYPGQLGIGQEGAPAEHIFVNGESLTNLELVDDLAATFSIIMKDGGRVKKSL